MAFENLRKKLNGTVHFIGLGGIGMSALALVLNKIGVKVQGSDLSENYLTQTLRDNNIHYVVGHNANNISDDICLVVKTSIIKDNNPEIIAAQEKNIKIVTRANLLAQIMSEKKGITIAGTHGKTSTTALTALCLELGGFDPIVINGGVINNFKSNFKFGNGNYLIAESDESDGSFVDLPSFIGAITNIEPEHLEFYDNDFNKVKSYFKKYITQIPQDGLCAVCIDDDEIAKIYEKLKNEKKNLLSYSIKKDADLCAQNIVSDVSGSTFDAVFKSGKIIKNLRLSSLGIHNVSNSLVAITIANFLGVSEDAIRKALKNFTGVKRRFTKTGEVNGVAIIDDYAHHPTEISATLQSARQVVGKHKILLVLQPHKYTRLKDLFNEFCECVKKADMVIVADIYSAGQNPIEGASQDNLIDGIKKTGYKNVFKLNNESELAKIIKDNTKSGDLVICAGAGSITYWANNLPKQLQELKNG
ncbi:MAG TPA: UDP-N-acetylmuramate--L-alanine ligase [Rickettsiales bacterium]|nr:UDP-N-acetylmuramate--L-alanine ligase [Rickettsiales bacterium]